jgi:Ca2+-binding EF-hand superfamily protein
MRDRARNAMILLLAAAAAACSTPRPAPPIRPTAASVRPSHEEPAAAASRPSESPAGLLLARWDADRDGRITRAEYGRGQDGFANLDRDQDGVVTRKDFGVPVQMPAELAAPFLLVRRLAGPDAESIPIGDIDESFEGVDGNQDGAIDREEFSAGRPKAQQPGAPDRFAPLLAVADADKDGRLSLAELRTWATARDKDGDGRISVRERMKPGREPKTGWFEPADREPAPAFDLPLDEGDGSLALASFRGKMPVALIFGSFT